jgi:hypothetical protein
LFVPEVLEVQVVPSVEVRMVPELPTETNNGLEVVVVVVVAVESVDSSFSAQEMTVRLKREIRKMCKILFIFSSIPKVKYYLYILLD